MGPAASGVLPDLLARFGDASDRTAVVIGERALSYRELDRATALLAGRLTALGVGPGRVVLIRLRQSADTMVAMVAALRSGAAWCVIEPGYPDEWLGALLRDIDCGAVVYDSTAGDLGAQTAALAPSDQRPPVLDIGAASDTADIPDRAPETAPAYVITTSGSTGVPKAVVVSRANLANLVASRDYPQPQDGVVALSALRLTWDGALIQTFWALCLGGTVVLPDHRALPDPETVAGLAHARRATHLYATPSFYRLMLPYLAGLDEQLGTVALAGEVLSPHLARRHREVLPGSTLINEYGPTEATGTVLRHRVLDHIGDTVPIGSALGRSAAYLLTDQLREAASGIEGDLALGGPQVADGYAARPGDTATRFVADPFAARPGARMYLTGDRAARNLDGDIIFHGRLDSQVKVRGARVECDAVAEVLRRHPSVADAVALAVPNRDGEYRLAACWVAHGAVLLLPSTGELLAHCAEHLPAYSVPERLLQVGSMPLAPSGKVDTAALHRALGEVAARQRDHRRTRWTPTQREVADLWADILEHDDFDLDDPFLRAGGNSHRVVELHIRLEQHWPGALRVGQLFDETTVRAQAEIIDATPDLAPAPASAPLVFEL